MPDWTTVADLATAAGTALLALATFASTRSANRSARSAERALLEGLRPILMPSDWNDPVQKIMFHDGKWLHVRGGRAALEVADDAAYLVLSVRNVGRGLAVLHGWKMIHDRMEDPSDPADFFRLTRDIYIAAGGIGFGQIAIRDTSGDDYSYVSSHLGPTELIAVDLLYGDAEGTQRIISRFAVTQGPAELDDPTERALTVSRHWNLDLPAPR
jgi:hypothetical protein